MPQNRITDIPGLRVGHATDLRLASGVTAILFDQPAVAAVDVRGGGPGTRETDLLDPERTVERVDAFVAQRAKLMEAVTPIRRAAAVHGPSSPGIRARVTGGHEFLRSELEKVFAPEIEADRRDPELLLDMLDVAASWTSWDLLRSEAGRSIDGLVPPAAAHYLREHGIYTSPR